MKIYTDFNEKKVKINVDEILSRKRSFSQKYLKFLDENKNKIFTAEYYSRIGKSPSKYFYTLKEDDSDIKWIFTADDFILIEGNDGN